MKKLVLLTIFLSLLIVGQTAQAYTTTNGIQEDDIVKIDYILTVDGEIEDQGQDWQTEVSTKRLIVGMYENLLGMKVDEEKEFDVPPHQGYTKPDHELYGLTLHFEVYVVSLVSNVNDSSSGDSGIGEVLKNIGTAILVIAVGAFAIYLYASSKSRSTNPYCVHCKSIGKKTRSDGYCSKCSNYYCRASFSKGCPSCKNNTLIPNTQK